MELTPYKGLSSETIIRYLYTGREYNIETGDYYYRYRMMETGIGRFTSKDPIKYLNRYAYVDNKPLKYTDIFGLSGDIIAGGALGGAAYAALRGDDPIAGAAAGVVGTCVGLIVTSLAGPLCGTAAGFVAGSIAYEAFTEGDVPLNTEFYYSLPSEIRHAY